MAKTPSVVTAVRGELRDLEALKEGISRSAAARVALAMARELDDVENPASGMAACARVLENTMAELRLAARRHRDPARPPEPKPPEPEDKVADLTKRRAQRRAGT